MRIPIHQLTPSNFSSIMRLSLNKYARHPVEPDFRIPFSQEYNVKATLFVMSHTDGQEWYPGILARAVKEGHELGNHGTIDEVTPPFVVSL